VAVQLALLKQGSPKTQNSAELLGPVKGDKLVGRLLVKSYGVKNRKKMRI